MVRWKAIALGLVLMSVAFTGCLGSDDDGDVVEDGDTTPPSQEAPPLPDDIHAEEDVTGSADPYNFAGMGICSQDSAQCFEYPFTAEGPVNLTATLTWTDPSNDFDLYLFQGDEQIKVAGDTPPETEESFAANLGAGDYELVVVAWLVKQDTFTFEGVFAHV